MTMLARLKPALTKTLFQPLLLLLRHHNRYPPWKHMALKLAWFIQLVPHPLLPLIILQVAAANVPGLVPATTHENLLVVVLTIES